ncbi:MAG: class I mannose-6-phosphate isomerase [Candidatus Brocadiae bacterium]|nr:class I mannose-6-phosphate isomerase [Candidatus Brocadiia bacterium]
MPPFPQAPLTFREILVEKPWGGRRLGDAYGKKLPARKLIGESWEVACREGAVSVIAEGAFKGKRLDALLGQYPREILGTEIAGGWRGRFPLLVKIVDVASPLSIQVHPSDEFASVVEGDTVPGKIEAWVVLAAGPKARLYKGLVPGMTKEKFAAAIAAGDVGQCLNVFPLAVGDVILMPPGTVHGAEDALFGEFQQNSDTTYRLWDWARPGPGGRLRPLHLDRGLAAIDYHTTGMSKCRPAEVHDGMKTWGLLGAKRGSGKAKREVLVRCGKFALEGLSLEGTVEWKGDPSRFYVVMAVEGQGTIRVGKSVTAWKKGRTFLFPAAMGPAEIASRKGRLLWCYVP